MYLKTLVFLGLTCASAVSMSASIVNIGFLTFDHDSPITGENQVTVNNFTGTAFGCGFVDSTLPVCTSLNLLSPTLTVNFLNPSNVPQQLVVSASTIAPGTTSPFSFTFLGTKNITSIQFSGSVDQTSLSLFPAGTFSAASAVQSAPLVPGTTELVLLTLNPAATGTVPEPATYGLLAGGCVLLFGARRRLRPSA